MFLYSKISVPWEIQDYKQTDITTGEITYDDNCIGKKEGIDNVHLDSLD